MKMNYIIINNDGIEFQDNNKKKVFKKWLKREIKYVQWVISTYDKNDDEEKRYIKQDEKCIKKAKKYMKTFDKDIDGYAHIKTLLKILNIHDDVWADYKEIG